MISQKYCLENFRQAPKSAGISEKAIGLHISLMGSPFSWQVSAFFNVEDTVKAEFTVVLA